ncbi:LysR family transcriptional regulator [Alkalimarinus sediminis]|uniref:LysR family transcriptional regulator n=1 Tax=Alkalimarinus sediminis TaxID=1632866 RepID=A0A9E8HLD7_9ALTE|nr:LysR family transcriptional regulator [Alkalimarinus sediminis]UZW76262.1 LysR family transcriptional regulator [Alkalimarinus sediminis]
MNIANFDLNLLRAFDVLMRERNVSLAAERMNLSQPAMSNTLNRLRQLLDDPVLVRTRKGMQPTPRAMSLEQPVRSALQIIEQSLSTQPEFKPETAEQTFHIATTDYVELAFLPKLLKHINEVAPSVRLEIHALGPDMPEAELEGGLYDFAIGRFPSLPARLKSELWLSEQLVCLVRDDHPSLEVNRDNQAFISLECFLRVPQIWVNGGQRVGVVDKWLLDNNLSRNVAHTTPSFLIAPSIVAQTDMLVVTPMAIAEHFAQHLALKILLMPMKLDPFDLQILWHPYQASTPAHEWFLKQLRGLV